MAFDFAATAVSHILSGPSDAFKITTGNPVNSKFIYGTVALGNDDYGILVESSVKTTGDKTKIKGANGTTFAKGIMDPGFAGTLSVLFPTEVGLPQQGKALALNIPSKTPGGADAARYFMIDDFTVKWSREGFRMVDIEVDSPDSILGDTAPSFISATIKGSGAVGTVIENLDF